MIDVFTQFSTTLSVMQSSPTRVLSPAARVPHELVSSSRVTHRQLRQEGTGTRQQSVHTQLPSQGLGWKVHSLLFCTNTLRDRNILICSDRSKHVCQSRGGGGGENSLIGLFRYVWPQRVWFLQPFWS